MASLTTKIMIFFIRISNFRLLSSIFAISDLRFFYAHILIIILVFLRLNNFLSTLNHIHRFPLIIQARCTSKCLKINLCKTITQSTILHSFFSFLFRPSPFGYLILNLYTTPTKSKWYRHIIFHVPALSALTSHILFFLEII